jgi:hypothetical protein
MLNDLLKSKNDIVQRQLSEVKIKMRRAYDTVEDVKKDVQKYTKVAFELRKPYPEPKEPIFPELPPIPYVPTLPASGGLDKRGKKKKALLPNDLKTIIEGIEIGSYDGNEIWEFPEDYFPSQAQIIKLGKTLETRNTFLDEKRKLELNTRDKIIEGYHSDHEKWEIMEKRRLNELEKAKKDCRKINVKYDCCLERLKRFQEENANFENDIANMKDLSILQEKSMESFKMIRLKQSFEMDRQIAFISSLKKRLLRAINARKFALEYPKTAIDELTAEEYRRSAEESLRFIKYEIYECKMLLFQEGIRLKQFLQEEETLLQNELTRMNISIEILIQRDLFENILVHYKIDLTSLFMEIEKYKLLEAETDDLGKETIEDLGEKYLPTKVWNSGNVIKIQRSIDLSLAKIKITENYGRSAGKSQKYLINVLSSQYGENYFIAKDSWIELSEYERSQRLLVDTIQYLTTIKQSLQQQAVQQTQPLQELQLINSLITEKTKDSLFLFEKETLSIKESAIMMLDAIRNYLANYRKSTEEKIGHLEASIIDLSRECQKIREELLSQQMVSDEKMKVLWAFIHTLQTAIQQLSAKMEMVTEDKEKVVIESRLLADNTRYQLRQERRHASNLLFIVHSQRGFIIYLQQCIQKLLIESKKAEKLQIAQRNELKRDVWETVFTFTRLCTDVDMLFEFFVSRLANLSGSREGINNALARNNAAVVLASLCKNPRSIIRRNAARALGNMGWNSFIETRILLWDCIMYWKSLKKKILTKEKDSFEQTLNNFSETGKYDAILLKPTKEGGLEEEETHDEFIPSGNLSLRSLIKQRRQWALRAARRIEGPNTANQKLLNIKDGVLPALLEMCVTDGGIDWEISRNAALAIAIASYELSNHQDMIHNDLCLTMIITMCQSNDVEVQTHAATTIANLSYKDENAQHIFGTKAKIIPILLEMLKIQVADVLEASTAALANLTCYCDFNCYEVIENNGISRLISIIISSYSENLLDIDQNDEVHANAAETLANVSRFNNKSSISYFLSNAIFSSNSSSSSGSSVIDALVLMCASNNKQLKRHVCLVIGNIAQNDRIREEIGKKGGIESLFLTIEDNDIIVQSNALWALANLMWYPPNQERAGRFMKDIVDFIYYDFTREEGEEGTTGGKISPSRSNEIQNNTFVMAEELEEREEVTDEGYNNQMMITRTSSSSRKNSKTGLPPPSRRKHSLIRPSGNNNNNNNRDSDPSPFKTNDPSELKRYQLMKLIKKNHHPEQVVINATMLLGNVLYYNANNRVRYLEIDNSLELLLLYLFYRNTIHVKIIESCLRCLLSLSYLDSIALFLGTEDSSLDLEKAKEKEFFIEDEKKQKNKKYIPLLLSYCISPFYSRDSMKYALETLCNCCLHHINRKIIFDYSGIDIIVSLHTDTDEEIRSLSMKIIDYLEDITPKEILAKRKALIGLERMVTLVTNEDPLIRSIAAEAIGEEIYNANQNNHLSLQDTSDPFYNVQKKPTMTILEKQRIAHEIGAIDSLLTVIQLGNQHFQQFLQQFSSSSSSSSSSFSNQEEGGGFNDTFEEKPLMIDDKIIHEDIQSIIPSLWSLRNTIHHYYPGQMQFYLCNGISILCQLIRNINTGFYQKETKTLLEATISCLIAAISDNHEKNSRKLVMVGLDAILELTKESMLLKKYNQRKKKMAQQLKENERGGRRRRGRKEGKGDEEEESGNNDDDDDQPYLYFVVEAIQDEGLQALVSSLLLALGPFNYVVCVNCQRKQDLHGTSCVYCGHRLLVDVQGIPPLVSLTTSETNQQQQLRTSQSAKELPWKHAGKALATSVSSMEILHHDDPSKEMKGTGADVTTIGGKSSYFSRTLPVKNDSSSPHLIDSKGNKNNRPKT